MAARDHSDLTDPIREQLRLRAVRMLLDSHQHSVAALAWANDMLSVEVDVGRFEPHYTTRDVYRALTL